MSGITKTLFGGSSSKSTSSSTPIDMTPGEFKNLRNPLVDSLMKIMQGQMPGQEYTGPLNASMTANEGNILNQLMSQTGAGTSRNQLLEQTLAGNFLPGSESSNPFLEAAITAAQRSTTRNLEETLSRTLPGRFTQAGQFVQPKGSSAFDRAAAIATEGAANAMADIATNMSFGAYESERGRQQEAVNLSRAEVDSSIQNLQAQALPRLIQELGIERGLGLFQQKTQQLLEILKTMSAVSAPTIANKSESSSESESEGGIIPGMSKLFGGK